MKITFASHLLSCVQCIRFDSCGIVISTKLGMERIITNSHPLRPPTVTPVAHKHIILAEATTVDAYNGNNDEVSDDNRK